MRIGLGLPNAVADVDGGRFLIDLAVQAERLGFATVATIGRVAYPSYEELVTLAGIAGATSRIGLLTDVLLGPTRETVLLAKQAATLHNLSEGRFVLGVGVGAREDDFTVSGSAFGDRGKRWDAALELMHAAWRGEPVNGSPLPVTPTPFQSDRVPILVGGRSDAALRRVAAWGIGYTQGGGTPEALAAMREKVEAEWAAAGREGKPEYRALAYVGLGPESAGRAERNLHHYYGPELGPRLWQGAIKDAAAARERVAAFAAHGADELILFVEAPSPAEVDRLAEAVLR